MAKSIMIQGTMSGAGKSLIAGALCRIFASDGYRTAPFKSQNMALNSFVTSVGLEMGRAQVMQAEAAGCEPDVRMNPILLKPTSDVGSQVIINGRPIGNMTAREYFKRKTEFIPHITEAYSSIAAENDIVVIEGAGSPAEINLKTNDIVNMGMARLAKSPVLLAGDIDRGGVFAQLFGTVELLEPSERAMIKGLIINKFRGDVTILQNGLDMLFDLTKKPVLGVVPYMDVDIDDEDSLTEKFNKRDIKNCVDIAIIRLPRISNFTDFTPFDCMEGLSARYVGRARELGLPDMIVIPGTKSTMSDMKWLRESGIEAAVLRCVGQDVPVFGICGGFQMLGRRISDPYNTEGGGEISGMGLLDVETVFEKKKTTARTSGRLSGLTGIFEGLNGADVSGYEIHMGRTDSSIVYSKGNIYGSYLHGIFDNAPVMRGIASALMRKQGINPAAESGFDMKAYKEAQYDILADTVRKAMDIDRIYDIIDKGIS